MSEFAREEIEQAWETFQRLGVGEHNWEAWADLFTDDARYEEHVLGTFDGRDAIKSWITATMADYANMTLWIEWSFIDGNRVAFYIWNNLPDPVGDGTRYGFPNTTIIEYAGDGQWSWEADFYDPADAERVWRAWYEAGGRPDTPPDPSLRGIDDWAPSPPEPAFSRSEIERELEAYRERGAIAVATGDWNQWADQFTEDATYLEHHYGRFEGREGIRGWILGVMQPFPEMVFPVSWYGIDGNRVVAHIPNVLPDPTGGDNDQAFDVFTILHYAGNGKWSYEEDVYNPREAEQVIRNWVAAGGVIPS